MRIVIGLLVMLFFSANSLAETPNKDQRAFIDKITIAIAADDLCDESRINQALFAYLMEVFKISSNDIRKGGKFWPTVETYYMIARSEFSMIVEQDQTISEADFFCDFLMAEYGPNGSKIPDFIKFN